MKAVLVAFLLSSCAHAPPQRHWAQQGCSPVRVAVKTGLASEAVKAAAYWNEVLGRQVFLVVPWWPQEPVRIVPSKSTIRSGQWLADIYRSCPRGRISIDASASGQLAVNVIAHEMGHILGLWHNTHRKAIRYEEATEPYHRITGIVYDIMNPSVTRAKHEVNRYQLRWLREKVR